MLLQVVDQSSAFRFFAGRHALFAILFGLAALAQSQPPLAGSQIGVQAALDHASGGLTFIENRGQWDAEARYLVRVGGLDAWVTDSGLVFDFYGRASAEELDPISLMMAGGDDVRLSTAGSRHGHVVRMEFEGATADEVTGAHRLNGYHNYFLGDDPSRWATNVPLYGEVIVSELYEGVGMRLYDDGGLLRYDLLTAPGADLSQVRLRLDGAGAVWVTPEGDLAMETSLGEVRQAGLLAYQEIDGRQVEVPADFRLLGDGVVGFELEPLNPALPLVVDPVIYSTFLGGERFDWGHAIVVDPYGNALVAGETRSTDFPTTPGAYQTAHPGLSNAFVTKLDASGSELIYSTYLGGGRDVVHAIAVDASGSAFVAGHTWSTTFPTTEGAYQTTHPGGENPLSSTSAFVTKLDASGSELIYSTYLGGFTHDDARDIALDFSGNAFVAGNTLSTNFPTTDGAYQTTYPGGERSTFITKLDAAGAALIYSTYLGSPDRDIVTGLALDTSGHAFVAGYTLSTDFPTTEGGFQTSPPGGASAFVTKLDAAGTAPIYSTYLGGAGVDASSAIAVDASGNAIVVGNTSSTGFPTTQGVSQTTYPGGERSAFVTKLDADGAGLIYSTYLGGANFDFARAFAVDASGNTFVTGQTNSIDFPTAEDAYQTIYPGGQWSAFATKLDSFGGGLIYSTYVGGADIDRAWAIAVDASGNAFVTGYTTSINFPTTAGAYQTAHPGYWDWETAFVTKLDMSTPISTKPGGSLPTPFALQGAYPNPFTSQTMVVFVVPHAADVRIEVYDLLGRRVATVVDAYLEPGTHERVFEASALPSRVYVVRMTSGGFSQALRLVVVR